MFGTVFTPEFVLIVEAQKSTWWLLAIPYPYRQGSFQASPNYISHFVPSSPLLPQSDSLPYLANGRSQDSETQDHDLALDLAAYNQAFLGPRSRTQRLRGL